MNEMLLAGYARVDITPLESVPLGGYGNTSKRMSANVLDPLYLTVLAFTDAAGTTALVMSADLLLTLRVLGEPARQAVEAATGVPMDRIIISSTHNHSSPDVGNLAEPSIPRYNRRFTEKAVEAAQAALADRKPVTGMYAAQAMTQGLNFVRRYILEDGTAAGDNYGHFNLSPIRCHESEADRSLGLVKLTRDGGKDIVLANFQTHPHRNGGGRRPDISADIVAPFRDTVEAELDCLCVYLSGAAGNVNPTSRIPEENTMGDHLQQGRSLAKYAIDAAKTFRPLSLGPIAARYRVREFATNHSLDHLVEVAKPIYEAWLEDGDHAAVREKGKPYGINSPYHCSAIVRHSKLPQTLQMPLWTLSVGDVAFVGAAYEMFDSNGMDIKKGSPYGVTFILTNTNEYCGYMPSALGFQNGGYSVDACNFTAGIGEALTGEFLEMLRQQKG